jgi:hypothetical protein
VAANVLITDEDAIKDAEDGKTQLSCGYTCDLDFSPGVTSGIDGVPDGLRFDAIQRNIVGNHVAIVDKARAGAEATLHLDGDDAVMVVDGTNRTHEPIGPRPRGKTMKTIKIDGVDFEMSEQAVQAVNKVVARLDDLEERIKVLDDGLSKEKARADKAEEDLKAEQKARKEDASSEKIRKMVDARVALETTAKGILKDDEIKLDEMSEAEIRKAVILKVSPGAKEKLDDADEAYVSARFDAAVESFKADEEAAPTNSEKVKVATAPANQRMDAKSARERMIEDNLKLGREPIRATQPNE